MKKLFALLLVLAMTLACTAALAEDYVVYLITMDLEDQHWVSVNAGAEKAVAEAKAGRIEACQPLIDEAQELLNDAHNSQTAMLGAEAAGEDVELGFIMVHAQDHLMTTVLLKDIVANLIDIYRG